MKVLILGTVRSRSSFLIDVICKHYNLQNLFEAYRHIEDQVSKKVLFKYPDKLWPLYIKETIEYTNTLKEKDNFAIKIFPGQWLNCWKYNYHHVKNVDWNLLPSDIMDIKITHNIEMYDKIFILKRSNVVDYFCSYISARSRHRFLYNQNDTHIVNLYKKNAKHLVYDENQLKISIIEKLGIDYISDLLRKENIKFTELEYDDVPAYVSNNFPNITSELIDPGFNYQELILNYDQIKNDLEKTKKLLSFPKI